MRGEKRRRDNPSGRCERCCRAGTDVRWSLQHGVGLWLCLRPTCRNRQGRWRAAYQVWGKPGPQQGEML